MSIIFLKTFGRTSITARPRGDCAEFPPVLFWHSPALSSERPDKQFRYRTRVCYCVWGGLRRSAVLSPGRQECTETIRMRHLELLRLNAKATRRVAGGAEASWHISIIVWGPDGAKLHKPFPRCHLSERKQWRVRRRAGLGPLGAVSGAIYFRRSWPASVTNASAGQGHRL